MIQFLISLCVVRGLLLRGLAITSFMVATIYICPLSVASTNSLPDLLSMEEIEREEFEREVREQIHEAYQKARRNSHDPVAVGELGMVLQVYSKYELGEICFRRASGLNPRSFRWLYYLANVEGWLGKHELAVSTIRRGLAIRPNSIPGRLRLAQLLFDSSQIEQSGEVYQELISDNSELATAHFGLGRVRASQGKWVESIRSIQHALRIFENYAAAHYALGMVYRRTGEMEKAHLHLKRYGELGQDTRPSDDPYIDAVDALGRGGLVHFAKGSSLILEGKLQQAATEFEEALKANPRLVSAHANLITLYANLGMHEKSERHFRTAHQISPGSVETYTNWAGSLALQGRTAEALEIFERALRINPHYADAHVQLGSLLEEAGRRNEAVRHYGLALESNPTHRQAHYLLGRSMVQSGRFFQGIEHLLETIKVEDRKTPVCMQTLAIAYKYAGQINQARYYLEAARERAASYGMDDLAEQVEQELAGPAFQTVIP